MTQGIATLSLAIETSSRGGASARAREALATLDEFVLGPENRLLRHGVGLDALPEDGGTIRLHVSPLTLYGPVGIGKTQLLHALSAAWAREHRPEAVILIDSADFARSYATAVKVDDVPRFQQRFQRIDCLLIDNVDGLQSKPGAQQQLATIIEHRQRYHRPTVLSAQQPLRQLGLSSRLSSRLASGLVVPLQLPSAPTRQVILKRLCERRNIELTADAERLLSERGPVDVPQLLGLVHQLQLQLRRDPMPELSATVENGEPASRIEQIDAKRVEHWLRTYGDQPVDARTIIRATARYFGLPQRNLTGSSRRKMDVLARSIAMFLIRELTGSSFQRIGQQFGGRDHTTVIHAYKKVVQQQAVDATTCHALREIRERLHERHQEGQEEQCGAQPV